MKAKEIAAFINGEIIGDADKEILDVNHLYLANPNELTYCHLKDENKDFEALMKRKAGIIIGPKKMKKIIETFGFCFGSKPKATLILTGNPRYDFARVVRRFFAKEERAVWRSCHIGKHVKIGKDPDIHPGVVIYDGTAIGDKVTVRANAVLGGEGLSLAKNENGEWLGVPYMKGLIIGDEVEVGVGTVVQKGTLKPTIIGNGTKIGPNCNISHQVKIGKHCAIPGMTLIGGHVEIGDYTYIGPHSTILNGVKIGKDCFVGIGSLVMHAVPDGQTVAGRPAIEIEEFKRQRKRLKELLK